MFQALIKIPEKEYWNDEGTSLPEKAMSIIKDTSSQFTNDPAWNTIVYEGYKIVNFIGETTIEKLKGFVELFKLDWEILAANDGYDEDKEGNKIINTILGYDPKILINYIARKRIYDEKGILIKETEPDIIEFGRFAGLPILEPKA